MKHNYLNNTPPEEALERFLSAAKESGFKYEEEEVPAAAALGRALARAVYAKISSPHYNASAMDGIALVARRITSAESKSAWITITPSRFLLRTCSR